MMTSNTLNNNHHPNNYDPQRAKKAALSSFAGAVVDWYDFLLYGLVAALVFKTQFFPSIDPNMGTLAALATFGVGFLFRPLGGIVFGHYGDKLGRKKMLFLTVFLMGGGDRFNWFVAKVSSNWLACSDFARYLACHSRLCGGR